MAALLVEMHKVVEIYIKNDPNRRSATEIGSEVLQLTRAVIKKHTFPGEKAYKFHLAQPLRILKRTEKDQSISHLIVNKDHPASMKYAKNSEVLTFRARYGHFNRHGVPQHCLV